MTDSQPEGRDLRHAKSVANPDWPHESYCTGCGQEWPCERENERRIEALNQYEDFDAD